MKRAKSTSESTAIPQVSDGQEMTTAAANWQSTSTRLAQVKARLRRLLDAAEHSGQYGEADDFRNYEYADAVDAALNAAMRLLRILGYDNPALGSVSESEQ